jgi:DNA-binding protein YbaB
MFNKLKQIKDLRHQAKTLQGALSQEKVVVDKKGIHLAFNGNLELTDITISEEAKSNLENNLKDCLNDGIKQVQKVMAKKMQDMGGMPELNNLFKK